MRYINLRLTSLLTYNDHNILGLKNNTKVVLLTFNESLLTWNHSPTKWNSLLMLQIRLF